MSDFITDEIDGAAFLMTCGHMLRDIRIYDGEYSKAKADVLSQRLEVHVANFDTTWMKVTLDARQTPL
jgi:hypothetical protein